MRFLKCMSCGAIVKEIVPCNCENCGFKCCSKQMEEIEDPKLETTGKIITCESCKAQVEIIVPCNCENCGIKCCSKEMK